MSVFNDRDARSKLSASNKGRCVLGGIVLLVSVDREKQCWVSCRQPNLRARRSHLILAIKYDVACVSVSVTHGF
jgi:hypothetical protein